MDDLNPEIVDAFELDEDVTSCQYFGCVLYSTLMIVGMYSRNDGIMRPLTISPPRNFDKAMDNCCFKEVKVC